MKAVPLAALAATAAIVLSLHAQDSENPAPPPAPQAPPAKPYLVIDAQPSSPANAGNGSSDRLARLEAQLNQAAATGYRLAAAHQDWIIMEHISLAPAPVSNSRRRVVLPVND
jgi:hypothetical protein